MLELNLKNNQQAEYEETKKGWNWRTKSDTTLLLGSGPVDTKKGMFGHQIWSALEVKLYVKPENSLENRLSTGVKTIKSLG